MNTTNKISGILFLVMFMVSMSACTIKQSPLQDKVMSQANENTLGGSKNVQIFDTPYLGATSRDLDSRSPEFDRQATLSQRGSITEIAQTLETMFPLSFQVQNADNASHRVYYKGDLKGLLDAITLSTGYGWQYSNNTVTFAEVISKTYTIYAIPGKNSYSNNITNKSKENSGGSGGGAGQTVSSADTAAETAQTTKTEFEIDAFEEIVENIKGLLSPKGTVTANQGAGTITVQDKARIVSSVDTFIEEINTKMARQVALNIQVWSLEISDDTDLGFNLNVLFEEQNMAILAGSASSLANNITASIVSGKLKGSQATLNALKKWGNASSVTSASGIAMNNQPLPTLAVQRQAYLASMSTEITDYGQNSELTPGEITTGFAMTIIPHILEKREVILQYNVNISKLDDIQRFSQKDITIDLPQTSNRSFSQRMRMQMGQTLVLAGYQQDIDSDSKSLGFLSGGKNKSKSKSLLIITIQVENADI